MPLSTRQRPLFFMLTTGMLYPLLISLFPFVLPYVMHDEIAFSRLMIFINTMILLHELLNLGLGRGITQLAIQTPPEELRSQLPRPLRGVLLIVLGQVALATLVLAGLWLARPEWFDHHLSIAFWLWLAVAAGLVRLVTQSLLYGTRRFVWFVGLDLAWAALRLAMVPLGWLWFGISGALAATALLLVVTCLPAFAVLGRAGLRAAPGWRAGWQALAYFFRFGLWIQITLLAGSLLRPLVVLIMAALFGRNTAEPGFAHLALSLFLLVMVVVDALFMGLYPEKAAAGAEADATERRQLLARALDEARLLGFVFAPLCWLGAWISPWAAQLLPLKFHGVGAWLAVIAFALPARGMGQPAIVALQAAHDPRRAALWQWLRLACVLMCMGIGFAFGRAHPLAPMWGIVAGEWAATLLLLSWAHAAASTPPRLWLIAALFAFGSLTFSSLAVPVPGGAMPNVISLSIPVAWLLILPLFQIVNWVELRQLLQPHLGPRQTDME